MTMIEIGNNVDFSDKLFFFIHSAVLLKNPRIFAYLKPIITQKPIFFKRLCEKKQIEFDVIKL